MKKQCCLCSEMITIVRLNYHLLTVTFFFVMRAPEVFSQYSVLNMALLTVVIMLYAT